MNRPLLYLDCELAEILRVTRRTIANWRKRVPDFPRPIRIGNTLRTRAEELDAFLASRNADHDE